MTNDFRIRFPGSRLVSSLLAFTLAAFVLPAIAPATAMADIAAIPVSGTPVLVRGGAGSQTDPHISGALVSYTDSGSASSEIRYHDLTTGIDAAISNGGHRDSLSDVDGTTIVFRRV